MLALVHHDHVPVTLFKVAPVSLVPLQRVDRNDDPTTLAPWGDFGFVKVCVHREATDQTDNISVEGDLPFHPETTQAEELELLISRTVGAAARLQPDLMPDELGD